MSKTPPIELLLQHRDLVRNLARSLLRASDGVDDL
jgi:hypothetical protein